MEEIFEAINKELTRAGRAGKLPSGAVLTGGSAKLKGLSEYAKESLGLAARVGKATGFGGVADGIDEPQFATAVGLMLIDSESTNTPENPKKFSGKNAIIGGANIFSKILGRFRT